jgi:hypothetical protein
MSLSYGRRSVYQFVLVSGYPLGPMTIFNLYTFFSDNCLFSLLVGCPLWWEDGSVTYSAIADRSGHWRPVTIHYRLIWDRVPSSSPLTTRCDYGGGILTTFALYKRVWEYILKYNSNKHDEDIYTRFVRFRIETNGKISCTRKLNFDFQKKKMGNFG